MLIKASLKGLNMWLTFAILAAVLWGLNYTIAERLLQSISPVTLLAFEMVVGSIIFIIAAYFTNLKSDTTTLITHRATLVLTIIEIITVVMANLFIVYSIRYKNATVAGMVELTYPLFTILFTWLLFRENHVNFPVALGSLFIILGVVLISFA